MPKNHLNYFSRKEKRAITKFKNLRTELFLPVSKLLMKIGLDADIISYFGFLMLAGFIYFVKSSPLFACYFLLAHVLIDAFDGPLARLMKRDGDGGAFTDIVCDHTGMVVVVITFIYANLVNPILAGIYIYLYTVMILFVIWRNKIGIPIKLVIRTKYYLYILYGVFAIWQFNYLNYGLGIFSILMFPSIVTSYYFIKKKLGHVEHNIEIES